MRTTANANLPSGRFLKLRIRIKPPRPDQTMKLACVYSCNIKPLFDNFAESLDAPMHGIDLRSSEINPFDAPVESGFRSEIWYAMISHQIQHSLKIMSEDMEDGEYLISCDVDIHFFKPQNLRGLVHEARTDSIDFMALEDHPGYYNTGFVILKRSERAMDLYLRTLEGLSQRRLPFADQDEINRILPTTTLSHRPLSPKIGTLGKQPVHQETVFYHATAAHGMDKKLLRIATAQSQMKSQTFGVWQDF
jgi:hypothetical protein